MNPIDDNFDLYRWRDTIASEDGPPSTTRFVLLVLSLHMNRAGECHPSIDHLAKRTGLTTRAVGVHLREAARAGWLSVGRRPGKHYRQRAYQAISPDRGSCDPGSDEQRSPEPSDVLTRTTIGQYLTKPFKNHPVEETREVLLPGTSRRVSKINARPPAESVVPLAPEIRRGPDAVQPDPPRVSLGVSELVNELRSIYPHPTNDGRGKRTPSPGMIENWIGDVIRKGKLEVDGLAVVLEAARHVAKRAERHPDEWRVALKTWIKDAQWGETIEEEDKPGPVIPPPSTGPRFTPKDWNQPKEDHGRLDDRSSA